MRTLHRWLGTIAGLFLAISAISGIFLQIHEIEEKTEARPAPVKVAPLSGPAALAAQVTVPVEQLLLTSTPTGPVVSFKPAGADRWQKLDPATGTLSETLAPGERPKPTGFSWTRLMKGLHTGGLAGIPGHLFGALLGLSLLFFTLSGLWMWWQTWRHRARAGRGAVFWR